MRHARCSAGTTALLVVATLLTPATAAADAAAFSVPSVKDAVRGLHAWKAGGILIIPTVSDGAWYWNAADAAPAPKPLSVGRVENVKEWNGALYLATEKGLFSWTTGDPAPVAVEGLALHSFRFGEWGNRLLVYADDGLYYLQADGPARRLGKEHYFWAFTEWEGRLWYGNLNGLFSLASENAAPERRLPNAGGVDSLVAQGSTLFIGTRGAGRLRLDHGSKMPTPLGASPGFYRSQIDWNGQRLVATDSGIWNLRADPPAIMRVGDVWGGFQPWGKNLLIGANAGLFVFREGASTPELVLNKRVESMFDWNGTAVISTLGDGLWLWKPAATEPHPFPVRFGAVDSFALWRGGVVVGLDDRTFVPDGAADERGGSLAFLDERVLGAGTIDLTPLPRYEVGQPIVVLWKIANSRIADIADMFRQTLAVVDETGHAVETIVIAERNRKRGTDFEATLKPLAANGSYRVAVTAEPPLGAALVGNIALLIGAATPAQPFRLSEFMGWRRPADFGDLTKMVAMTVAMLGALYYVLILLLFAIRPAMVVWLNEAIATGRLPSSDFVAKMAVPLLVGTQRCLDAFVRGATSRALQVFDHDSDVKTRATWVPAPIRINGELIVEFRRPADLPANLPYVPGLFEIRRATGARARTSISIEGPGGIGKSALAFQIARWSASESPTARLLPHRMLPVLVDTPGRSLDEALKARLAYVFDVPRLSDRLLEVLLRERRVLAIVDGVSEKPSEAMTAAIRPDAGAAQLHALVVTSRLATRLPECTVIVPQGLTLTFLDGLLGEIIARNLGAGRFTESQRETIRERLKAVMGDLATPERPTPEIPMVAVILMLRRADELVTGPQDDLAALPSTFSELVQGYVEQLLRGDDEAKWLRIARRAAVACLAKEFVPTWQPLAAYAAEGLTTADLDRLVTAGLLIVGGTRDDVQYKFALDPMAETLAAKELMIRVRDKVLGEVELRALRDNAGEHATGFREILSRASVEVRGRPF